MNNFLEYFNRLSEVYSSNILYHRTSPMAAINILKENTIKVGGTYLFNHTFGKCICFSRDYNFIKQMPGKNFVVFVFDKDRLNTKFKIEPITDYKNFNNFKGRTIGNSKAEEICFKDISSIHKYLLKIIISDEIFEEFVEELNNQNIVYNKNICVKASEYNIKNLG